MPYKLTNKAPVIQSKVIDGETYYLSDKNDDVELWIMMPKDNYKEPECASCGYKGVALDKHHIHGRKNSDETIYLCSNCHRELHNEIGYKL